MQWYSHFNYCSLPGCRTEFELTVQQAGTFPHIAKAISRFIISEVAGAKPFSVVRHDQVDVFRTHGQVKVYLSGAGMLENIVKRLLCDAEDRDAYLEIGTVLPARDLVKGELHPGVTRTCIATPRPRRCRSV